MQRKPTMKVLISTSTFPIRLDDGLPRFVYDLADALAHECKVTVLAPAAPGAALHERMGSVEVHRFRYFWPERWQKLAYGYGMRDNMRASRLARLQPLTYGVAQALAIRSLVRRHAIDVVNSHWMIPQGLSAALARAAGTRFRHVLSVHAGDVYMLRSLPAGRRLARFVMSRTEHVFADGSHVGDSLDTLLGSPSGVALQPMGVRCELFAATDRVEAVPSPYPDGYLLFVGRFAEKKGVTYLLQAMPRVIERHPNLGLILVGYGTMEPVLRQETAALGIERAVTFAGQKPHAEVVRYLHGCRAVVVPSIIDSRGETEGMPTVVVEAMAAGTRVVASAVDGIPDVIRHAENGWLCREKDPHDLASKILVAMQDPTPSMVVQAAVETAQRYDWRAVATNYQAAFRGSLSRDRNIGGAE